MTLRLISLYRFLKGPHDDKVRPVCKYFVGVDEATVRQGIWIYVRWALNYVLNLQEAAKPKNNHQVDFMKIILIASSMFHVFLLRWWFQSFASPRFRFRWRAQSAEQVAVCAYRTTSPRCTYHHHTISWSGAPLSLTVCHSFSSSLVSVNTNRSFFFRQVAFVILAVSRPNDKHFSSSA